MTAASYFSGYQRAIPPDFAVYFDPCWEPPWPHVHVDWPDSVTPAHPKDATIPLESLLRRARESQRVEVGCLGGHGRTGTALGCLVVLTGVSPTEAVTWVRTNYCPLAIETDEQVAFIEQLA